MIFDLAFKWVQRLFILVNLFPIFHLYIQDRMAGANTGVYEFDSMVRGLHVYETI